MKKLWSKWKDAIGAIALTLIFTAFFAVVVFYIYVKLKQALYFSTYADWIQIALIVMFVLYVVFELWRRLRHEDR